MGGGGTGGLFTNGVNVHSIQESRKRSATKGNIYFLSYLFYYIIIIVLLFIVIVIHLRNMSLVLGRRWC